MKKKVFIVATIAGTALIATIIVAWVGFTKPKTQHASCATDTGEKPAKIERMTGPMNFGRFMAEVVRDDTNGFYFLQLRGARLPFKASPLQAQSVDLQAPGKKPLEKNTALLYAILGREVEGAALLINPDEKDQVMPAAEDIARYVRITNPRKFAGVAYTKPDGTLQPPEAFANVAQAIGQKYGLQIAEVQPPRASANMVRTLDEATAKRPLIQLKGPKSGAIKTGVSVVGPGQIIVEGKTYEDLYTAADSIGITLLKMVCGSSECPDAAACATGGKCGCGG